MTSTTSEPEIVAVQLGTLEELRARFLEPIHKPLAELEGFAMGLSNAAGFIDSPKWEARLTEPPTIEEVGAFAIFLDDLEYEVDHAKAQLDALRRVWPSLTSLHEAGEVALEVKPD